jgi:hypothetical protein
MVVATPGVNDVNDPALRNLPEALSPIEALFVTRFLLKQKQTNETYQTTPLERSQVRKSVESLDSEQFQLTTAERNEVYYELLMEVTSPKGAQHTPQELAQRVLQARSERAQNSAGAYTFAVLSVKVQSVRTEEINKVFRRAFSMKISEALALTDSSIELIGIPAPSKKE